MSLKTKLQAALDYGNEQLAKKGVSETATTVAGAFSKIAEIEGGALEDIDVYVADYKDKTSFTVQHGAVSGTRGYLFS